MPFRSRALSRWASLPENSGGNEPEARVQRVSSRRIWLTRRIRFHPSAFPCTSHCETRLRPGRRTPDRRDATPFQSVFLRRSAFDRSGTTLIDPPPGFLRPRMHLPAKFCPAHLREPSLGLRPSRDRSDASSRRLDGHSRSWLSRGGRYVRPPNTRSAFRTGYAIGVSTPSLLPLPARQAESRAAVCLRPAPLRGCRSRSLCHRPARRALRDRHSDRIPSESSRS